MDNEVKEYIVNGVRVRIHGGQPDRKRVEAAMQIYGKALIEHGYNLDELNARQS